MDGRNFSILRTILNLARNLHREVVAEGLETAGQVNLLTHLQGVAVQGY